MLEREERLLGVQRVRGADVHDVDRFASQELSERVVRSHIPHLVRELLSSGARPATDGHNRSTQIAYAGCLNPCDEAGADDGGAKRRHRT